MNLRKAGARKDLAASLQSLVSRAHCRQCSGEALRRDVRPSAAPALGDGAGWEMNRPGFRSAMLGILERFQQPGFSAAFLEAAQKVGALFPPLILPSEFDPFSRMEKSGGSLCQGRT
jgi:hypothetical protein